MLRKGILDGGRLQMLVAVVEICDRKLHELKHDFIEVLFVL